MASSSSSSTLMKYHVFLSFRGEDTRLNFTTHLLQALEDEGLDVFFDEEKLERGEQLSQALSRAIAVSNISIIVLSEDYASSKSCLAELSDIMDRKHTQGHIVLPIFYHVDPSDVRNIGGSFKKSFDEHETKRSVDEVKRWKLAFAEVGKLEGRHIDGSISDRPETQYIKDIVVYVMQKLKHRVFLSLGEDTRLNFSNHLVKGLEKVGVNVFPDNETLGKEEKLLPTNVRAISASNLSILVLSKYYASSKSCLRELSDIMDRKRQPTDKHIVLPVFYHVDPSNVRNISESFKTSFQEHESKEPADIVQRWKSAFAEVGKLKGWHIEGGKCDRSETEYINEVVEYVLKKLANNKSRSASEELVGIDYQKETILKLIKQKDRRVLGLYGMGGQGKTTLAEAVFNEISSEFESRWFLQNVREKIEKQGKESLRNELFSKLLNSDVDIGTPSIGSTLTQERLKNKKLLVALDDVDDSDQIHCMGVKHFGYGSIIIITSRDRQVLKSGGADTILEVKGLNTNNSLQLFSTFAFKQLNPPIHFQNLSRRFVKYTQGNPLALRVLGSDLYERDIDYWNSKVEKLKDGPPDKQILEVLKSSYDGLGELEKNIFLDIVCLFKGELIEKTKLVLSNFYKGVECGIIKLVDKCLISVSSNFHNIHDMVEVMRIDIISQESESLGKDSWLWCHDMLEEMGKDIVSQESKSPGKRSRLWCHKDVEQILKYNKNLANLREIDLTYCKNLRKLPNLSEVINLELLRCIDCESLVELWNEDGHTGLVNLRQIHIRWCVNLRKIPNFSRAINLEILDCSNCKSLIELWNEDDHMGLVNLREIYFEGCVNLRKIPNLSRAIKLEILDCSNCESLVELWNEDDHMSLVNLREIRFCGCVNLRKIPNFSRVIKLEILDCSNCESLVELWNEDDHMGLVNLREIRFCGCLNLRKIPNFSRAINLEILDCSYGESLVELWNEDDYMGLINLREIYFEGCVNLRKIPNLSRAIKLEILDCSNCESLVELWNEDDHMGLVNLREIRFFGCMNLRKIPNFSRVINLEILDFFNCKSLVELWNEDDHMGLVNLRQIFFDGCVNLRKIPNLSRVIKLQILDCSNCESLVELWNEYDHMSLVNLKEIRCGGCVNLRKIPNLLGAINLRLLHCYNCESLVELPCLNHLASLAELLLYGCSSLKKFPQVPCHFCSLNLSETGIEEVPDSIKNLHKLETLMLGKPQVKKVSIKLEFLRKLDLSGCPITELRFDSLCNLQHLNMSGSAVKNVSSKLESLRYLHLSGCPMVELLSELPPYLEVLSVNDCKSLEKVSFADQNLNHFGSLDNEFCRNPKFLMQFRNCLNLNQESTKNIEANAMLKIGSLSKEWAATYARKNFRDYPQSLICCFPGNEILTNNFKDRSLNSSLSLKIAPNGGSGSRFLVFAICLVANLAHRHYFLDRLFNCEYQLTAAGGGNGGGGCENFISNISFGSLFELDTYMGYHVFILSSTDMVIEDKNYEEASFNFYIGHLDLNAAEGGFMEVERYGVHVFYVDKKSDTDATEKRVAGNKRSFSHDGEEGDGGLKRLK